MVSCFRAFRKPKNAEEERNLIEIIANPKSTRAMIKWSLKIFVSKIQQSSLAPSQLTSLNCKALTRIWPI